MNTEYHDQVGRSACGSGRIPRFCPRLRDPDCRLLQRRRRSGDPSPSQEPPPQNTPPNSSGLDARPSNTTCIAPERATGSVTIGTQRAFPNLRFRNHAVEMLQAPGDASRWFVAERFGVVHVFDNKEDVAATSLFVDIDARVDSTCAECGLLGMAFHPDFPATPRVYLTYTTLKRTLRGPDTHLSEFTSRDGGLTLDPDSERVILTINKGPVHHHGGHIALRPRRFSLFRHG